MSLVPNSRRYQDFQRQIDNIEKLFLSVQYKGTLLSLKRYRRVTLFGKENYHQSFCSKKSSIICEDVKVQVTNDAKDWTSEAMN